MNIQAENLQLSDKKVMTISYLAMLQPILQYCGSEEQNVHFDHIYRRLVSGRNIDQNDLRMRISKLTSVEEQLTNTYSGRIIKMMDSAMGVFDSQSDAAFYLLIEELTGFLASLNAVMDSLEDIVEKSSVFIERLEEKQEKIGKYVQVEKIKCEETDLQRGQKTYAIHSDLDNLFQEATEEIVKILAGKGTVNKQAYVDQVVFGVRRMLKIPAEVIGQVQVLQRKQDTVEGEAGIKKELSTEPTDGTTLPSELSDIDGTRVKEETDDAIIMEFFTQMDKATFLDIIKNLSGCGTSYSAGPYQIAYSEAKGDFAGDLQCIILTMSDDANGPVRRVRIRAQVYYDLLRKEQARYKFTKAQQKQLALWLENAEKKLSAM